ncbi:MAG: bifunctional UDP-N-acetylglucosamine diphosphorylase/glucosamine-1-phosphate N-acetyltransferase GlmU [Thiolinea sp.]
MKIFPIVLAAGQGTRMHSSLPKVLHAIAGKPMLQHVVDACFELDTKQLAVVYGHGGELVQQKIRHPQISWALQAEQKGTGHAVAQAIDLAADEDAVLVAYGDVPLIRAQTLQALTAGLENSDLCVLSTCLEQPKGYGRIVRDAQGNVTAITEEKDADDEIRQITEVNSGFIAARGADLKRWLRQLTPKNSQGEYYLTDCVGLAVAEGLRVNTVLCDDPLEVEGANNRVQLARLEREAQRRQVEDIMLSGASVADPARLDIRGSVSVGSDVFIDINVLLEGEVTLGNDVVIEPNCVLKNVVLGDGCHIKANSHLEQASVAANCDIGPFARIRPGTELAEGAKIGNFVETKKAKIGRGSKVNHLSYVGDTNMGDDVNIGAGTITCNYDGANKHITMIADGVFVGSGSQLVAPVSIEAGATIGAGSTITKQVAAGSLALTRAKQVAIQDWQRPVKEKK